MERLWLRPRDSRPKILWQVLIKFGVDVRVNKNIIGEGLHWNYVYKML
jgi:hypothetical protein